MFCVWLLFSSYPHSLFILFLLVKAVNELRTEKTNTRILLNTIFITQFYNDFVTRTFFPSQEKLCKDLTESFFFGVTKPIFFSDEHVSRFLSEASWEIVIFVFVYFITCLFFHFLCYCFFYFLFNPPHASTLKLCNKNINMLLSKNKKTFCIYSCHWILVWFGRDYQRF